MANKRIDEPTGVETVGHEWDGIEELNNPLPKWWVYTTYLTIIFAIGYMVVYPAIPMLHSGTQGMWGWSSRGQLAQEVDAAQAERAKAIAGLAAMPIEDLNQPQNKALLDAAIAGGKAAFRVNCVQCHGAEAGGTTGYPSLKDDDWLWGGSLTAIEQTITNGIRQPGNDATRNSMMPSFGKDGILTAAQISDVASHVRALAGKEPASAASGRGAEVFAANCAVCHGADAKGMREFGAPNLTDAIWLYGDKRAQVVSSISTAHAGVMPAWTGRLDPVTIKMLAAYVHSLGGGEDFAEAPATPTTAVTENAQP